MVCAIEHLENDLEKYQEVQQNRSKITKVSDLSKNFINKVTSSRLLNASAFSALSIGALLLLFSNPVGWLVLGSVASTAFVTAIIAQIALDRGTGKISSEISAIGRFFKQLFTSSKFDEKVLSTTASNIIYAENDDDINPQETSDLSIIL
jgi:hypothetical protein